MNYLLAKCSSEYPTRSKSLVQIIDVLFNEQNRLKAVFVYNFEHVLNARQVIRKAFFFSKKYTYIFHADCVKHLDMYCIRMFWCGVISCFTTETLKKAEEKQLFVSGS